MAKVKQSENLFEGIAELNKRTEFLEDSGFKRHALIDTASFGLVEQLKFPVIGQIKKQECFYVSKAGTPFDEIVLGKGVAVDSDANLIVNKEKQNFEIANDGNWYWVKISHQLSTTEDGTVSLDATGNLTGVGTKFTKVLRGQPNYPSKIRLENSLNGNADDYEVVKVIDDTSCIISGDFNSENNLKYGVVGTFTPGYPVPAENQMIFRYDSVKVQLVRENNFNIEPAHIADKEFFVARVKNTGIDLTIQDKRKKWWRSEAFNYLRSINRTAANPIIGVENIRYGVKTSTQADNFIQLAFGFRINSYTIDTSSKKISILIGNGGVFKDTSQFTNGDFNGWRIYSSNGDWKEIIDSQDSGTQIVVTLDVLNPTDYTDKAALFIAPPYEEIEVKVRQDGDINTTALIDKIFNFPINTPIASLQVPSFESCYKYNLTYRYKIQNDFTDWKKFPNDTIGYYDEDSFDDVGNLKVETINRTLKPYTGHLTKGFIEVCPHPDSFWNFKGQVVTGDVFGVNTSSLDNSIPVVDLIVGRDKRYQHYTGTLSMSANMVINLAKTDEEGGSLRQGNEFILHIDQFITLNNFTLKIVQDYSNPTSFKTLANITSNDTAYIKNNSKSAEKLSSGLFIRCTFDDTGNWICHYDSDINPKGMVRMLKDVPQNSFTVDGMGVRSGFWGWRIVSEMQDQFVMGTAIWTELGQTGGTDKVKLTLANIPSHRHEVWGRSSDRNTSGSGYNINQVHISPDANGDPLTRTTYTGGLEINKKDGAVEDVKIQPKHIKFIYIEKIV